MSPVERCIVRFLCAGALLSAPVLCGQQTTPSSIPAPTIAPAGSHQHLRLGNSTLSYTASWSEVSLKDSAGIPQATISFTSYVRDDVSDRAKRPVLFAFNGGPGASSSPLHFGLLGPRRMGEAKANGVRAVLDNDETAFIAASASR